WDADDLTRLRAKLESISEDEAQEQIEEFLDMKEASAINEQQRVILLAEAFEYEVVATAEWLCEKYDLDIRCYKLALATDHDMEFLSCTCIFPPPELRDQVRVRSRRHGRESKWLDWDAALNPTSNVPMQQF